MRRDRQGREKLPRSVTLSAETAIKYEGYIKRQIAEVHRRQKLEEREIPADVDYAQIPGIRIEARQKLTLVKPLNIGQASRISGVSPADISVLLIWLSAKSGKNTEENTDV